MKAWLEKPWVRAGLLFLSLLVVPVIALFAIQPSTPTIGAPVTTAAVVRMPTDPTEPEPNVEPGSTLEIEGMVVDESDNPVSDAVVRYEVRSAPLKETRSDNRGRFKLTIPSGGEGRFIAKHDGFQQASAALPDIPGSPVTLRMKKGEGIRGTVRADGRGVGNAQVSCKNDPGISVVADSDGSFELPSTAEGCSATANHPDYGASEALVVRAGARNLFDLPTPGSIAGVVVDEGGSPVTKYFVAVESFTPKDNEIAALSGESLRIDDADGKFEFKEIARGRYILSASADGRPPAKSAPFEVESGRSARVRITLPKGLAIAGLVTDKATRKPLSGVRVSLDAMTSVGPSGSAPAVSDDSGTYRLEGVPAGPFSVRYAIEGYRERIITLNGRGGALKQDVELTPSKDGDPRSELTGIGATLGQGPGRVMIGSVIGGGPAERAGLLSRDLIETIDGESAADFSVADCVQRLRGAEGTRVRVKVMRAGTPIEFVVTREVIPR